jgi:aminoglycoside phosphotransferase (APT) family kinase protein
MAMAFGADAREWVIRSIGTTARSFEIVQLKGSTTSSVFLIQCSQGSKPQRFILRVIDNQEWLADEPDLVAHEAAALEEAQKAGLRAPRILACSSEEVGFGAPVVLMSFIEGNVEIQPSDFHGWLDGLAGELSLVHQHRANTFGWCYLSWVDKTALAPPKWTAIPHVWERAIDLVLNTAPDVHSVFIHRDYHPTNVLWRGGVVSGVVDWISACRGPAGVDVAHCRINLAKMFGLLAANQFLDAYIEAADGFEYDPYWDIDSLLDVCIPQPTFYPPWQEFGLDIITSEVLKQRVDKYLESVMMRI